MKSKYIIIISIVMFSSSGAWLGKFMPVTREDIKNLANAQVKNTYTFSQSLNPATLKTLEKHYAHAPLSALKRSLEGTAQQLEYINKKISALEKEKDSLTGFANFFKKIEYGLSLRLYTLELESLQERYQYFATKFQNAMYAHQTSRGSWK